MSLQKQGANKGATTAFLISTPESGVDSIAVTYALLDPIMTVARPVVAFVTAAAAGIAENFFSHTRSIPLSPDLSCTVDNCCDGVECPPEEHKHHHSFSEKFGAGLQFAVKEVWEDMVVWFFVGLLLAGVISVLIPADLIHRYVGGGFTAMLIMLAVGIPLYICATASTPIAAALILKGISPGAALVFLLAGPATNITSLTVLFKILGKRATAIYFTAIAVSTICFGLILDYVYASLHFSAKAMVGQASEFIPLWVKWMGAITLLLFSVNPLIGPIIVKLKPTTQPSSEDTACSGST